MMATELLIFKQTISSSSGSPPSLLLSSYKRRCWSEFLYILTFFVSTYKQTQGLHKYVPPCFQKCDKVFLFLFPPHATQRGESGLLALWAGYQKIRGKLRWAQQSYSKGWLQIQMDAFCVNGRLWRPLNEQIAGVKHLWNCHLRKRSREGEKRERGGEARGEKEGFWSWQISAGQRWATVYNGPAVVFWEGERAGRGSVWIQGLMGLFRTNLHQDSIPAAPRWSMSVRFERLAHVMKAGLRYKGGWWVEGWDRRTRGLRRAARTTKSNIEKAIRGRDKARTGEKEAKLKRKSGC